MSNKEIIEYFIRNGVIKKGLFNGKSGKSYTIETDLRYAFTNYQDAVTTGKINYQLMQKKMGEVAIPTIGVPETGTLISFFVNQEYYINTSNNFTPNIIRAVPKEYQNATKSVFSVLPLDEQPYIMLEDDVVTGSTVCKYLEQVVNSGMNIQSVVSVFGRNSAEKIIEFCSAHGITYYELLKIEEIERMV